MRELAGSAHRAQLDDASKAFDYGYITHDEYLAQLTDITGLSRDEITVIRAKYHVRNELLIEYVRELRQTYKIGLLSNIGSDSFYGELFTRDEVTELFDEVVLSSDIHIVKPQPEAFLSIAERLGVPPEECVMIDDLSDNVAGARAVSMIGVQYNSIEQLRGELEGILNHA